MLGKFEELEYVQYFPHAFSAEYVKQLEKKLPGVQVLKAGMFD